MFGLLFLVYLGMFRRRMGIYISVLLTMAVFWGFNSVLFRQYICWIVPFIPLALCDTRPVDTDPVTTHNSAVLHPDESH